MWGKIKEHKNKALAMRGIDLCNKYEAFSALRSKC